MSTTSLMTFAEFEKLPDVPGKQELIDGELITMPAPEEKHSILTTRITVLLYSSPIRERVRGDHTGYRMAGGWIEPDSSVIWPDQPSDGKYRIGAPMLAVELLSPGESTERKLTLYFAEGAQEVWVVDVEHRMMTVYQRRDENVVRIAVDREYRSETAQVTVELEELFAGI